MNLLKFRIKAAYQPADKEHGADESGAVAYQRYADAFGIAAAEAGGRCLLMGEVERYFIGNGDWDSVMVMFFPNRQAFIATLNHSSYHDMHRHRDAGLLAQELLSTRVQTAAGIDMTMSRMSRLLHLRSKGLKKGDPVSLPITTSSTYHLPGEPDGSHFYSRAGNPTVEAVEAQLSVLEDAETIAFPSGMAAITAALMAQLKSGDHILLPSDGYFITRSVTETFLSPFAVKVSTCPTALIADRDLTGFALVFIETPANPGLDVCDIAAVAARAKTAGTLLIADNTTATALLQQPLNFGADMIVSSDTKAISGHSDVLFGHVSSRNPQLIQRVRDWRTLSGSIPSPFDAFLVHRGLETLEVRLERMSKNAMSVAEMLAASPLAKAVRYPGLPTDPAHLVASRQMKAFGPIVSFELPTAAEAEAFIEACPLLSAATSFGGVHSSAERRGRGETRLRRDLCAFRRALSRQKTFSLQLRRGFVRSPNRLEAVTGVPKTDSFRRL